MDQPSSPYARFAWVRKHDGRLVPFEADKISRDLFAAGEGLGKPDAFLARELTDSILHFLDAEVTGGIPTTSQITDLVIKVVRELGQPELAMAFAGAQAEAARNGDREVLPAAGTASVSGHKMGPPLRELADWVAGVPAPGDLIWKTASSGLRDFSLSEIFTRDLVAAQ